MDGSITFMVLVVCLMVAISLLMRFIDKYNFGTKEIMIAQSVLFMLNYVLDKMDKEYTEDIEKLIKTGIAALILIEECENIPDLDEKKFLIKRFALEAAADNGVNLTYQEMDEILDVVIDCIFKKETGMRSRGLI